LTSQSKATGTAPRHGPRSQGLARTATLAAICAAAGLFSPLAAASDAPQPKPTSWTPHASLRAAVTWRDEGLARESGFEPEATTRVWLPWLEVGATATNGNASLSIAVAPRRDAPLREARVIWHAASVPLTVSAGIERVLLGGFEQADWSAATLAVSPWLLDHFPFRDRARVVETASGPVLVDDAKDRQRDIAPSPWSRPAATLELGERQSTWAAAQLLDDVVKGRDAAANFHKDDKQPAAILAVGTTVLGIESRIEAATYDLNHSAVLAYGLKMRIAPLAPLTLSLDQALDVRRATIPEPRRNVETRYHSLSIRGRWDETSSAWATQGDASLLEVDQPDASDAGLVGQRANSPGTAFDDNALTLGAALFWKLQNDAVQPYVSARRASGRFREAGSPDTVRTKAEVWLEAGVVATL
jgi:hypothetical protein